VLFKWFSSPFEDVTRRANELTEQGVRNFAGGEDLISATLLTVSGVSVRHKKFRFKWRLILRCLVIKTSAIVQCSSVYLEPVDFILFALISDFFFYRPTYCGFDWNLLIQERVKVLRKMPYRKEVVFQ